MQAVKQGSMMTQGVRDLHGTSSQALGNEVKRELVL
jgi:hypothetical protein